MTDRARLRAAAARLQPQSTDPGVWDDLAAENAALAPARGRANRDLLADASAELMAGVWTAIVIDQSGGILTDLGNCDPQPYHRIMVVRALLGIADVYDIQDEQVLYEAQGWKDPAVEWVEAQAVAAALNAAQSAEATR